MSGKSIFQASLVEALEYAVKYGNLEVRVVCGAALERYRKAQAEGSKIQGMEADLVILDELSQQADPTDTYTAPQTAAKMPCGTAVTNVYEAYEAGKRAAAPQPEQSGLYTCIGKGGSYELIGRATTAGTLKATGRFADEVIVYRDTESSALYCRAPGDFHLRMARAPQGGE